MNNPINAGDIPNWSKKGPKTEIIKEFLGGLLGAKDKSELQFTSLQTSIWYSKLHSSSKND